MWKHKKPQQNKKAKHTQNKKNKLKPTRVAGLVHVAYTSPRKTFSATLLTTTTPSHFHLQPLSQHRVLH